MRRYMLVLISLVAGLAAASLLVAQTEQELDEFYETAAAIPISRTSHNGLVNTSYQGLLGPAICTAWGDPFSPALSTFETPKPRNNDNTYSHTYPNSDPDPDADSHTNTNT